VGWGDVEWIGLAQERNRWRVLANSVMNLRVPHNAGTLSSVLTICGLSSSAWLHRVSYERIRLMDRNEIGRCNTVGLHKFGNGVL
jgi:hypothetical protein